MKRIIAILIMLFVIGSMTLITSAEESDTLLPETEAAQAFTETTLEDAEEVQTHVETVLSEGTEHNIDETVPEDAEEVQTHAETVLSEETEHNLDETVPEIEEYQTSVNLDKEQNDAIADAGVWIKEVVMGFVGFCADNANTISGIMAFAGSLGALFAYFKGTKPDVRATNVNAKKIVEIAEEFKVNALKEIEEIKSEVSEMKQHVKDYDELRKILVTTCAITEGQGELLYNVLMRSQLAPSIKEESKHVHDDMLAKIRELEDGESNEKD